MNLSNQAPYFGTYDPAEHYARVLFKPGFAVQARELNDIQAHSQYQLGELSNHIFKNGSRVSNARSSILQLSYVRCQDLKPDSTAVDFTACKESMLVTGVASGVRGSLVLATEKDAVDPATLFVQYNKVGIDGVQRTLIPGEEVIVTTTDGVEITRAVVKCPTCPGAVTGEVYPTGFAIYFAIDDGVFYYNRNFVDLDRQSLMLSKYPFPDQDVGTVGLTVFSGMRVGLDYVEDIITVADDTKLLDNALGYPNDSNPGADRLRIRLVLTKRSYNNEDGDNFILLAKVDAEGRTDYLKSDSEYSSIMDVMAKRTFEQAGNYTIRPFKVTFFNSLRSSPTDPRGWSTTGDDNQLVALVKPSVGYVLGYRTETTIDTPVVMNKARETARQTGVILQFSERAYFVMNPGSVVWPNPIAETGLTSTSRVNFYDAVLGSGALVGSCLVYNMEYHSGSGDATFYKYFYNDVVFATSKKASDVVSAFVVATGFTAAVQLDALTGKFELYNPAKTDMVFNLPYDNVKTMKSLNPASPGTMIVTIRKKYRITLNASGVATIVAGSNQSFVDAAASIGILTSTSAVTTAMSTAPGVMTTSASSIALNCGAGFAGYTATVICNVLHTSETQNVKTPSSATIVQNTTPPTAAGAVIVLNDSDVYAIDSVKIFDHTTATPVEVTDVTDDWSLDTAITEFAYGLSKLVKKTATAGSYAAAYRLHISYRSYSHAGTAGFYTIDSYSQMLTPDVEGNTLLTYKTLPVFDAKSKQLYPLASCIDFRATTEGSVDTVVPANNSTAIFEIEYYQGRCDLLQLDKDGILYVKQGASSDAPKPPAADSTAMALYQIWLKPYTYSLDDVSVKFIENRRYTMRDIGKIEERVANLEYYTALSLLEAASSVMSTKDATGADRYKNGFLVDDFSGFGATELGNIEFRAALDRTQKEMRPSFKTKNVKLDAIKTQSSGVQWKGSVATRPFSSELGVEQPFATKHISINPYLQVAKVGVMVLMPNLDNWSDDTILPVIVQNIDTGVQALRDVANAAKLLGTDWGSWTTQNSTIVNNRRADGDAARVPTLGGPRSPGGASVVTPASTPTSRREEQVRNGVNTTIGSRTQTYSSGEVVRDVQLIPYVRESTINFHATMLKPNTRVYPYFDGEPVSAFCRSIDTAITLANALTTRQTLALGSSIFTDANGECNGEFHVPAGRFFVGQKTFRISADNTMGQVTKGQGDTDQDTTYAETIYFAGGLDITKQETLQNITTPTFNQVNVSEGRTIVTPIVPPQPTSFNPPGWEPGRDPVAQSFVFDADRFMTGLDVYFSAVDLVNNRLFVEIRTMINGYPSSQVLSRKDYTTDMVTTSEDSTVPFRVDFDYPVFLQGKVEYCFVVGGFSPDTRIWVAKMGGVVVNMPGKIVEQQPSLGSSFRSQNGTTWNAEQFEDIKFKLYVAKFIGNAMTVVLGNASLPEEMLPSNPIETESGISRVRIFQPAHGFVPGDRVDLQLITTCVIGLDSTDQGAPPTPGQVVTTSTGTATIRSVVPGTGATDFLVTCFNLTGKFVLGQAYATNNANAYAYNFLLDAIGSRKLTPNMAQRGFGTILTDSHLADYPSYVCNGIGVEILQKQHTVVAVDGTGSFVIDCGSTATISSRIGGDKCSIRDPSFRYDVVNIAGAALAYGSLASYSMVGIGHGQPDDPFTADNYRQLDPLVVDLGADIHLVQPMKIASTYGETANAVRSLRATAAFTSFTDDYTSPVLNIDAFSATMIANIVDYSTAETANVNPNAAGRYIAETDPASGTNAYKYVSKVATLKNPAIDLRILIDVYKDINADFEVYVKRLSSSSSGGIDAEPWVKMEYPIIKHSTDLTDIIEYDVLASDVAPSWGTDSFISYRIKVVGKARNTCKPPIFKRLRTIALT